MCQCGHNAAKSFVIAAKHWGNHFLRLSIWRRWSCTASWSSGICQFTAICQRIKPIAATIQRETNAAHNGHSTATNATAALQFQGIRCSKHACGLQVYYILDKISNKPFSNQSAQQQQRINPSTTASNPRRTQASVSRQNSTGQQPAMPVPVLTPNVSNPLYSQAVAYESQSISQQRRQEEQQQIALETAAYAQTRGTPSMSTKIANHVWKILNFTLLLISHLDNIHTANHIHGFLRASGTVSIAQHWLFPTGSRFNRFYGLKPNYFGTIFSGRQHIKTTAKSMATKLVNTTAAATSTTTDTAATADLPASTTTKSNCAQNIGECTLNFLNFNKT